MSLLERVQVIVPEARSLDEAILIQGKYYRQSMTWQGETIEDQIRLNRKSNQIAEAYISLQEMSREIWGYAKPVSKPFTTVTPQEATA